MSVLRRVIGILLIIAAVGGFIFSLVAIMTVWRVTPSLTSTLQNTVALLNNTLQTTADGLIVTRDALKTSADTIDNLESTMETTAKTIQSTDPMVNDIANLMSDKLPQTIQATQQSLNTAQSSAHVIDSLLGSLSKIPLIGDQIGYNPDVPLAQALGEVSDSLQGLPESFASMSDNLRTTQSNLQTFQADISVMSASIGQIKTSVDQYEQVVNDYSTSIGQVQAQLNTLSARIPVFTHGLAIGLTLFLVWMMIAQLGLLTQGWELFTEATREEVVEEVEEKIRREPEVIAVDEEKPLNDGNPENRDMPLD